MPFLHRKLARAIAAAVLTCALISCGGAASRITEETNFNPVLASHVVEDHLEMVHAQQWRHAEFVWYSAVEWNIQLARGAWFLAVQHNNEQAWAEAHQVQHTSSYSTPHYVSVTEISGTGFVNGHPCGGALPSCFVLNRESHGTNAQNPDGRSASGFWQIQDATWGGFMGYARAVDAPGWVQDLRAEQLGKCNWSPPRYCA